MLSFLDGSSMQHHNRQEHSNEDLNDLSLPSQIGSTGEGHSLPPKQHGNWEGVQKAATAISATALSLFICKGELPAQAPITPAPTLPPPEQIHRVTPVALVQQPTKESVVNLDKVEVTAGRVRSRLPAGVTLLTIDDGPHPRYTKQMLDLLDKYDMKATFFLLGNNVKAHPELVREIVRRGHEVAPHSMSHASLDQLSPSKLKFEVEQSAEEIHKVLGADYPIHFFRAPYGNESAALRRLANAKGMGLVYWTIDSRDWDKRQSSSEYAKQVVQGEKDIVLLHDHGLQYGGRTQALEQALKLMKDSGVKGKTLSEIFHPANNHI